MSRSGPIDRPAAVHDRPGLPGRIVRRILELLEPGSRARLLKWFGAGLAMMGINTALLFLFVDMRGFSVPVATFLAAEACTLMRFLINHYWVFGLRNPTFRSCVHYHIANAGAFAVWWVTANLLTVLGMQYLVAGIAAVGCSTLISLTTNFLWIWRKPRAANGSGGTSA
jgi:putative flippase GtrA